MTEQQESPVDDAIQFDFCSDLQRQAVEAPPGKPLLLIGGFNSGKTTAAILRALSLCQAFPGYKVAVLRKSFSDLKLTTRPSFDQWITSEHTKDPTNEKMVTLKNGSQFVFHYLDQPNVATVLKGLEINSAILDQAEQMKESTFNILLGRLGRWKGAKVPPWVISQRGGDWPWREKGTGRPIPPVDIVLTANPSEDGDPELHWLWQRFSYESNAYHDKWSKYGYRSMTLPTTTNKFAGEQNIEFLMQQDEDYRKRFVEGVWVKSKGHLFKVSESSILDYDPELIMNIQNNMNLGRVLDHGDTAPTCCLWYAWDSEGNLFFWQEYYQSGVTDTGEFNVADHRRSITHLSRPLTFRTNLADPSIFAKSRGISGFSNRAKRWSVADEYMDRKNIKEDTTILWKPADNNEELSRVRLRQYLREDEYHRHPVTGELGAPHIYFIRQSPDWPHGVKHAIRDIRAAKRKEVGENDGKPIYGEDRDPTIPDHALDCVRYVANSRPLTSMPSPPKVKVTTGKMEPNSGRVIMSVPAIVGARHVRPERGSWKSRGGGY